MPDRPEPPDVPQYLIDGLDRQHPEKLQAIASYADSLAAWRINDAEPSLRQQFVTIEWMDREFGVPLSQLEPVEASDDTEQVVSDWHYWLDR
jgi:hypothetical protein